MSNDPYPAEMAEAALTPGSGARTVVEAALSNREGEHARMLARLRATEQAAEQIGTTLDERTTCGELARFVCPWLCDAAAVELFAEDAPAKHPPAAETPPRRCATTGQVHLLESETAVPVSLVAHGRIYGVLLTVRAGDPLTDHETATVQYAARLAAVHLGHARRHAAAQRTALNLQRALLSEPGRPHPNLELATRYLPTGSSTLVGGDWYETVRLHYGRTLLVMGDVMGHGIDAAVDMNAYRSMLRYVASTDLPPHRVLRQLDAAVSEDGVRRPATCLLVRADPARGIATFSSAGHLPPVVFTSEGTADVLHVPVGPPLGTGLGGYEPVTRRLTPEETLLMFTDGLVERRGEDIDESLSRLAGLRMPAGAGVDEILDEVLTRLDAYHAEDDVAVLAARFRYRPAPAPADS